MNILDAKGKTKVSIPLTDYLYAIKETNNEKDRALQNFLLNEYMVDDIEATIKSSSI